MPLNAKLLQNTDSTKCMRRHLFVCMIVVIGVDVIRETILSIDVRLANPMVRCSERTGLSLQGFCSVTGGLYNHQRGQNTLFTAYVPCGLQLSTVIKV